MLGLHLPALSTAWLYSLVAGHGPWPGATGRADSFQMCPPAAYLRTSQLSRLARSPQEASIDQSAKVNEVKCSLFLQQLPLLGLRAAKVSGCPGESRFPTPYPHTRASLLQVREPGAGL